MQTYEGELLRIGRSGPASIRIGVATAALGVLAALSAPPDAAAQTRLGIERGAAPEPLALETVDGETFDLADSFGDRPVVLQFWATWCPKCEALAPEMRAAHEEFGDRVDFYAVAVAVGQNPRRIRGHLENHPLPFPTLWDEDGEATRRFQAPTTSYVVMLDADGRVAYTGVDEDQDIRGALADIVATADGGDGAR